MKKFQKHTSSKELTGKAKELIEGIEKGIGFVPNLFGYMVEEPGLLQSYLMMDKIFESGPLTPRDQYILFLEASHINDCKYCMAAHTSLAPKKGLSAEDVVCLREGRPLNDPKSEVFRQTVKAILDKRGRLTPSEMERFFDAGYEPKHFLSMILGVSMKVITNYTNNALKTEIDAAFLGK